MKKLLAFTWLGTLIALFVLQSYFKGETTVFFGLTDDSGQTISFEYPVEITELSVVEGKKVEQGSILLKVRRSNLVVKQAVLNEKIHELDARKQTSEASIRSEIKSLESQKVAKKADLDIQIKQLQAKYTSNKQLLANITGGEVLSKSVSPLLEQVDVLKKQKSHVGKAIQAQIDNLNAQLKGESRPVYAQINALKEQRSELDRQESELLVRAELTGKVGNILYKEGETVDAFQPILSIHALQPEFVKGYIHENIYNKVQAKQKVWVSSTTLGGNSFYYEGTVENIGNRIVEYPQRLRKSLLVSAWGREVLVRLNNKSNLLLGEKVSIALERPQRSMIDEVATYITNLFSSETVSVKGAAYVLEK